MSVIQPEAKCWAGGSTLQALSDRALQNEVFVPSAGQMAA